MSETEKQHPRAAEFWKKLTPTQRVMLQTLHMVYEINVSGSEIARRNGGEWKDKGSVGQIFVQQATDFCNHASDENSFEQTTAGLLGNIERYLAKTPEAEFQEVVKKLIPYGPKNIL